MPESVLQLLSIWDCASNRIFGIEKIKECVFLKLCALGFLMPGSALMTFKRFNSKCSKMFLIIIISGVATGGGGDCLPPWLHPGMKKLYIFLCGD